MLGFGESVDSAREILPDAGWCWFHEPRIAARRGIVWFGAVSSGYSEFGRKGEVIAARWNTRTGKVGRFVLSYPENEVEAELWSNDHNAPALLVFSSGRVLAAYALHGKDNTTRFRSWLPLLRRWTAEKRFMPTSWSRITYSNLVYLSSEKRTYNFFRGLNDEWKPSWASSDARARSWSTGGILINFAHPIRHRPYLKVCSNGRDTIHFAYSEGHPRDYPNSLYHASYRSGVGLVDSEGKFVATLETGLPSPASGTLVVKGGPEEIYWVVAINDFGKGGLFILYSVRKGAEVVASKPEVSALSYGLAHWDGHVWRAFPLCAAGPQLYFGEDD